ncbi:hypothetical protein GPECTOR_10g770 [Gonium pectorale]|uniref:DNA (cytosine-5-)-methyltransferase n=1 Tax=Gonium pectorale TaxID=33097 RepID=A0A150GQQ7_GONPE|nr:hypothetical protein GPECTOR_10g770 [Gonium pectorale]|eukprot:KXZ52141.1 hypothetical protein GPECTOR_10g770 [Gonium pectorale]
MTTSGSACSALHPKQNRRLSALEVARAQGFPDNFALVGSSRRVRLKQVGNAVPPPLAEALGWELHRVLATAVSAASGSQGLGSCNDKRFEIS